MTKLIFVLILISCSVSDLEKSGFKRIIFKERMPKGSGSVLQKYHLHVPKGGKLIRGEFTGDFYKEYRVIYPDSSVIYISNKWLSGSYLNLKNRVKIGHGALSRKLDDTLILGGTNSQNKYWREAFFGEMVIGYVNVKMSEKSKFDSSISTLKKVK